MPHDTRSVSSNAFIYFYGSSRDRPAVETLHTGLARDEREVLFF